MTTKAATPSQRRASEERDGRRRRAMDPRHSTASGGLLPRAVERVAGIFVDRLEACRQVGLPAGLVDDDPVHPVTSEDGFALGRRHAWLEEEAACRTTAQPVG